MKRPVRDRKTGIREVDGQKQGVGSKDKLKYIGFATSDGPAGTTSITRFAISVLQ